LVSSYFGRPELSVRFWDRVVFATFVAVPEAAVDEDNGFVLREDDVWRARELADILSVAETSAPDGMA
jgi:hypothetical protein